MNLEENLNNLQKLKKKKKWGDASKKATEIAEFFLNSQKDVIQALKYYEIAIEFRQNEKNAEAVILLYRKIITAAKKGRNKTQKELFRYAAAAIPLIEEFIHVLEETNHYISNQGAITKYFLGECREIVSGIQQRDREFLQAGRIFIEVGKNLSNSPKTEKMAEEAFEKSRTIFEKMRTYSEEIFESLIIEAEINIRNFKFDRGFFLFDEAKKLFDDDNHLLKVVNIEKTVYAEIGLNLIRMYYNEEKQREIANNLLNRARGAHLMAKTLGDFLKVLIEIAQIHIENTDLESAFNSLDEAISNAQFIGDESIPRQIIEYLFHEGKTLNEKLIQSGSRIDISNLNNLEPIKFFNKLEEICKRLDKGQEAEDVALYIWQMGLNLIENKIIKDDFTFLEKSVSILISHSRINGLHKIGEYIENKIDEFALKKDIFQLEQFKNFIVNAYSEIGDLKGAGWVNVKVAKHFASWGDYEREIKILSDAASCFQKTSSEQIKEFADILEELFKDISITAFFDDFFSLLTNTYLQIKDENRYDSLHAEHVLRLLELGDFPKALELHQKNFAYLRKIKNINRAIKRVDEVVNVLYSKKEYELAADTRAKQIELLIETISDQGIILDTIKSLQDMIDGILTDIVNLTVLDKLFHQITQLYNFIRLIEAQGDTAFEIGVRLFELELFEAGIKYLDKAYDIFYKQSVIEKCGLVLDFISRKKDEYEAKGITKVVDLCLAFLIKSVKELDQPREAAELLIQRGAQLIPEDEQKAFSLFEEAKELISKNESIEDLFRLYHIFGTALIKFGNLNKGLQMLEQAKTYSSTKALEIADTCLTAAKDKFKLKDYDTYFILIDHALTLYSDLEMFNESSSIALTESRKLWSVGNLPYAMIFLEKAWSPLSKRYDEKLSLTVQPLIEVADEYIEELMNKERYDELSGFIELQERIFRHLNRTDKVIEVEKKKINALIRKGSYERALSQIYDITTLGIEESKLKQTTALLDEYLPFFVEKSPSEAKDLLKLFFNIVLTLNEKNQISFAFERIDHYIEVIIKSFTSKNFTIFEGQIDLFFNGLSELAEAEDLLSYFTIKLIRKMAVDKHFPTIFQVINNNIDNLKTMNSDSKIKIITEIASILKEEKKLSNEEIIKGLDSIMSLAIGFRDNYKEIIVEIYFEIAKITREKPIGYKKVLDLIIHESKEISNVSVQLNLLYKLVEEDLAVENYLEALKILDEAFGILENSKNPQASAMEFIELLENAKIKLSKQKKKNWLDSLDQKLQILKAKYLLEKEINQNPSIKE